MSGYVILVDFGLKPGAMESFRRLIDSNAKASVRDEPGCRRFDVLTVKDAPDRIVLYEIYDDRAAFEAHLKTPHFAVFDAGSAALVSERKIVECSLVCEGSAAS